MQDEGQRGKFKHYFSTIFFFANLQVRISYLIQAPSE